MKQRRIYKPHKIFKISFCTTCGNRLDYLKSTLPKNIDDNRNYPQLEFVILDYNSSDGLGDWIKPLVNEHSRTGLLNYYRADEPKQFHMAHAKNMVARLASGDIICNIDADNFAGKGFAKYVNKLFNKNKNAFASCVSNESLFGKNCIRKIDFLNVNGYDESFSGYGNEDIDLYNRLSRLGIQHLKIDDEEYLRYLENTTTEKVSGNIAFAELEYFIYTWKTLENSEVILLYKNHTYIKYLIEPINAISQQFPVFTEIENGDWKLLKNDKNVYFSISREIIEVHSRTYPFIELEKNYLITDTEFIASTIKHVFISNNLKKLKTNGSVDQHQFAYPFGTGKVKRNFGDHVYII